MQVVLVMFRADGERRSFSIVRDMTVVGRREDCDLRIPLGEVSRKHCRIIKDGETVRLEDLGSSNGTFHNGERVQEATLAPGDSIQVGPVAFVLQIDGVPADDELQPPAPKQEAPQESMGDFLPVEEGGAQGGEAEEIVDLAEAEGGENAEALPLEGESGEGGGAQPAEGENPDFDVNLDDLQSAVPTDDVVEFDLKEEEQPSSEDRPA